MKKLDGQSLNLEQTNLDKLKTIFPECVNIEGKVDIEKLLALFGEYEERQFEKYKFEWAGKAECLKIAQKRSSGTLRPAPDESVDFDTTKNLYIEGDNLEVLKILQKSYYRRVKMIYIDPPYNTGNDFVYNDDFADPIAHYKEVTSQATKSNPETMGRFHTAWLNMMYPRLRLAANLLRDDGVIFISIDETEQPNLRKICDEVFGEENHVADFVWHNKRGGGNDAKHVAVEHEYVIMYAKQILELQELFVPYSPEYMKRYKEEDEQGKFFWDTFKRKSGKQYYPIACPDGTVLEKDELGNPISWLRSEARFHEDLKEGEIRIIDINGKWSVQFKQRLPEGKKPRTIFLEESIFENQGTTSSGSSETLELFQRNVFSNPKPLGLIKHLLSFDTSQDDLIVDFFSGSSTTAHAIMQLNAEDGGNRRFICVQLPENLDKNYEKSTSGEKVILKNAIDFCDENNLPHTLCEIGKERIRRAGTKIKAEFDPDDAQLLLGKEVTPPPDVGFRVFKLDTSNLKTWDTTPISQDDIEIAEQMILDRMNNAVDVVKPDRTEHDMVYEIMLKMGYTLDMDVEEVPVSGNVAYGVSKDEDVGNFALLIFLSDGFTPKMAEELCKMAPGTLIVAEKSFENMTVMQNVDYICGGYDIELKIV